MKRAIPVAPGTLSLSRFEDVSAHMNSSQFSVCVSMQVGMIPKLSRSLKVRNLRANLFWKRNRFAFITNMFDVMWEKRRA